MSFQKFRIPRSIIDIRGSRSGELNAKNRELLALQAQARARLAKTRTNFAEGMRAAKETQRDLEWTQKKVRLGITSSSFSRSLLLIFDQRDEPPRSGTIPRAISCRESAVSCSSRLLILFCIKSEELYNLINGGDLSGKSKC